MDIVSGDKKIVVDDRNLIFGEYRRNLRQGSSISLLLNELQKRAYEKIHFVELNEVQLPSEARAGVWFREIPAEFEQPHPYFAFDPDDRKFLAVAHRAREISDQVAILSIDSDWCSLRNVLLDFSILFEDLCNACR